MSEAILIYPHQLFKEHPAFKKCKFVFLIEDPLFFTQYNFHKKKIILHRASMKAYVEFLEKKKIKVIYIESKNINNTEDIIKHLETERIRKVFIADPKDNWLIKKLNKSLKDKVEIEQLESPNFITSDKFGEDNLCDKSGKPFMHSFYIAQRKELNILIDKNKKPYKGKWSFDADNRKKLPKDFTSPRHFKVQNKFINEASDYVSKNFINNPGEVQDFNFPITFSEAEDAMEMFFEKRFKNYGNYQDAIDLNDSLLFHSVLSPAINIGLLNPLDVVTRALKEYEKGEIEINSLEGLIRQIIGWREFMHLVYTKFGTKQRNSNYFNCTREIPESFWNGTTNIIPIDTVIKRINETAYANHIERLMVLSNFMLLCRFKPNEVYHWFMSLFIDAYDWVMVPNVYGMSLYADGGLITTKPYVSSSNYILKMSRFKKGDWSTIWDSLYWNFIEEFRPTFEQNPRAKMLTGHLDRMSKENRKEQIIIADNFFKKLNQNE